MEKLQRIPDPTIARLPLYLRCLLEFAAARRDVISSDDLAAKIPGLKASQFRKDLSFFGEFGVQGMGYPVAELVERIRTILRLNAVHEVVLVGAGNLGAALLNYQGFPEWKFHITRVFDSNPAKHGQLLAGLVIEDVNILPTPLEASMAIMAVPASAAVHTARVLVESGIGGILNFTGVKLKLPSSIAVRNVDLTNELSILSYKLSTSDGP